ncbi:MAG: DUF4349 domain-containing protein [Acidimicrobiia bacterium]|nr:DUF4349 domain-containing protein [Acidimicrobiia bacterium]
MGRHRLRPSSPQLLFSLLATVALLLAACGSSVDTADDTSTEAAEFATEDTFGSEEEASGGFDAADEALEEPAAEFDDAAMDEEAEEAAGGSASAATDTAATGDGELGASGVTATQQTAADFGRKIIFTADITVEVDDVAAAGKQATDIIAGVGGFVFGQETRGGNQPESVLVFKVLPEDFDRAIQALGTVGELRNQIITADDVTERVVDLQTRIEVAELGVERLRNTLVNTQDLEDYAELERLLLDRETELEIMRGSLRTLQDRIDLATITLRLVQDAVNHSMALSTTMYHAQDDGASCPGNDGPSVESGTDITVCFEVINTGEEPIADLVFIDTALGIDSTDDLILVYGELDRLDGGQSLMLAYEGTADRRTQLRPKVTGRPITEDGEPAGPSVDARGDGFIDPFEPDKAPGFFDGFGAGVDVLQAVWTAVTVIVGFLLPMLVLLAIVGPLLWFGRRWFRSQRRDRQPPPPVVPASAGEPTVGPPTGQAGTQAEEPADA